MYDTDIEDDTPPERRSSNAELTLIRFHKFHDTNPHIYERFKQLAAEVRTAGHEKYSANAILARLRWHEDVTSRGAVKVFDGASPFYARMLMKEDPSYIGFFKLKPAAADLESSTLPTTIPPTPALDYNPMPAFDPSKFGSADFPLRPSGLAKLVRCGVWPIMELIGEIFDESGVAAETGSATHTVLEAYHRTTGDLATKVQSGLDAMSTALKKFPKADADDVRLYFAHYAKDPRNLTAKIVAHEQPVKLELPPHPTDPTGLPIVINGTLDQIREFPEFPGQLCVNDFKTGQKSGPIMVAEYALQLSAYLLAARASGFDVKRAAITRVYAYRTRGAELPSPEGVFWFPPITSVSAELLLDRVRLEVARVRSGEVNFGPGEWCNWCPFRGIDRCIPATTRRMGLSLVA